MKLLRLAVISLSKIENLKAIHNQGGTAMIIPVGCYQSVKDRKFESNSQLIPLADLPFMCCYQSVKDRKFESNSQP